MPDAQAVAIGTQAGRQARLGFTAPNTLISSTHPFIPSGPSPPTYQLSLHTLKVMGLTGWWLP